MKRRNVGMAVCATALITLSCGHRHDANQAMNGDDDGEIVTLVAMEEVAIDSTLTDSTAAGAPSASGPAEASHPAEADTAHPHAPASSAPTSPR